MSFRAKRREFRDNLPEDEGAEMNDTTLQMLETIGGFKTRPKTALAPLPEGALIPVGDGALQMGGYRLTRVGLVAEEGATVETWQQLGGLLFSLEGAIQWLIGDWIINGEFQWGQTYDEMERISGRENATLRDYVYVASNVQLSVRTDKLSFSHHKLVASRTEENQCEWLVWAIENKISVAKMRDAMDGVDHPPAPSLNATIAKPKKSSTGGYKPPRPVTQAKGAVSYTLDLVTRKPINEFTDDERGAVRERMPYLRDLLAWLDRELGE